MGSTERQKRTIKRPSRFDEEDFELTRQKEKEVTCRENLEKPRSDTRKAGGMERSLSKQVNNDTIKIILLF